MLTEAEKNLNTGSGEVYVTITKPGKLRGNHYHKTTNEWFTVVQGHADLRLRDMETGEEFNLELSAAEPVTLFVPCGIAHAFLTKGDEDMILIACTDLQYDPSDDVLCQLF